MTIYKVTKYDSLLEARNSDNYLNIVKIYNTACLTERKSGFITLLANSRAGLAGSVNLELNNFGNIKRRYMKNIKLDFSSAASWDSRIKKDRDRLIENNSLRVLNSILKTTEEFKKDQLGGVKDILSIIGKGCGLTPAGDDFIAGALNAAYCFNGWLFNRLKNSLSGNVDRTTKLSRYYLTFAAEGRAGRDMLKLLESVAENKVDDIRKYANRIMKYGANSGYYIIKGLQWALKKTL